MNIKSKWILISASSLFLGLVGCGSEESSQGGEGEIDYPSDNMVFTVPYPAGGVNDIVTRRIASSSEEFLGTSGVVENKEGGGGTIGATEYLSEQPNTHNILLGSRSIYVTVPTVQDVQFEYEDVEPIIGIDNVEFILYTNPEQSGIDSLESLIEFGRDNTINYGTTGPGTDIDLILGGLFAMSDVNAEPVQYGGGAEAITNVDSGTIHVAAGPPGAGKQLVEDESVVPIAVASSEAYEGFEGHAVPSLVDEGYDIDYPGLNFYAIRAGTDEEVVDFLYEQISDIYETSEFEEVITNTELDLNPLGPEEIDEYIEEQAQVAEELQQAIDSNNN